MSFITKCLIKLFSKQIGEDQFGNKYYISNKMNYLRKKKRYVIYNGISEPTKVPPLWHAWLHYLVEEIPNDKDGNYQYKWQKNYVPNLTGTKNAYNPTKYTSLKLSSDRIWHLK